MKSISSTLIWCQKCSYLSKHSIAKHKHAFFHYIYCQSGSGTICINNKNYTLKPGYMYITPMFAEHSFTNSEDTPLYTIEIKFELSGKEETAKLNALPRHINVNSTPIETILQTIIGEYQTQQKFHEEIIAIKLQELITYLSRCSIRTNNEQSPDVPDNQNINSGIKACINYIHNNIYDDLSLTRLATIAGYEKSYFLKKFKSVTSSTPQAYVKSLRISMSKELMCFSDLNITQIALAVGFKSVHHFSDVFLDCVGVRPLEYMRSFSLRRK